MCLDIHIPHLHMASLLQEKQNKILVHVYNENTSS
jgi:hypothetical protein